MKTSIFFFTTGDYVLKQNGNQMIALDLCDCLPLGKEDSIENEEKSTNETKLPGILAIQLST